VHLPQCSCRNRDAAKGRKKLNYDKNDHALSLAATSLVTGRAARNASREGTTHRRRRMAMAGLEGRFTAPFIRSAKTLAWMHSHTKFQCDGCDLEKKKIRKVLDAVAKAIDELRERLPGW